MYKIRRVKAMITSIRNGGYCIAIVLVGLYSMKVFAAESPESTGTSGPIPPGYKLVWADEFNGDALDKSKWNHRGSGERRGGILSDENAFVDGKGSLRIETRKVGDQFSTGMISTQKTFLKKYGYFEARIKFPANPGQVAGFWLQSPCNSGESGPPDTCGTEIDAVVFFRGREGGHATNAVHWGGYHENHKKINHRVIFNDGGDWHTFGVLWTENECVYYRDGVETWRTSTSVSHVPEYIILSVVTGGRSDVLDHVELPDRLLVDYVRVYSAADGSPPKD
jgi:beta-glucanase (GH16 family)